MIENRLYHILYSYSIIFLISPKYFGTPWSKSSIQFELIYYFFKTWISIHVYNPHHCTHWLNHSNMCGRFNYMLRATCFHNTRMITPKRYMLAVHLPSHTAQTHHKHTCVVIECAMNKLDYALTHLNKVGLH